MRALVCQQYGPAEKLVIEERPDPVPGAGQVLVDVRAAGINFVDVLAIAGNYQIKTQPPFIPGNEAASAAVAVAKALGAHVIAAASSDEKLEFARQYRPAQGSQHHRRMVGRMG